MGACTFIYTELPIKRPLLITVQVWTCTKYSQNSIPFNSCCYFEIRHNFNPLKSFTLLSASQSQQDLHCNKSLTMHLALHISQCMWNVCLSKYVHMRNMDVFQIGTYCIVCIWNMCTYELWAHISNLHFDKWTFEVGTI